MDFFAVVVLPVSGLLLLVIGTMRISPPIRNYEKSSGVRIENDVDLLNEVRGMSGLMSLAGAFMLIGAGVDQVATSSFAVGTVVFLGFGFGRFLSMRIDGRPNKLLVRGVLSELVLGALNGFGLYGQIVLRPRRRRF